MKAGEKKKPGDGKIKGKRRKTSKQICILIPNVETASCLILCSLVSALRFSLQVQNAGGNTRLDQDFCSRSCLGSVLLEGPK